MEDKQAGNSGGISSDPIKGKMTVVTPSQEKMYPLRALWFLIEIRDLMLSSKPVS